MFMKKRITFIATLLILACVALAGSSVWAAQSMKPEDVIAYNKSDPNSAPYTMISLKNLTIYYKGTGYTSVLGTYDISVNILKVDEPETDTSAETYKVVKHFVVNATTPPNVCKYSSGNIEGNFTLTESDLRYQEATPDGVQNLLGVKLEVYITGLKNADGNQIPQTFTIKQDAASARLGTFMPVAGSEIRTFFTTSIKVAAPDADLDDEGYYNVYSWLLLKKHWQTAGTVLNDDYFKVSVYSPEFSNPGYLTLDAAAKQLVQKTASGSDVAYLYDLQLLTRDLAANVVQAQLIGGVPVIDADVSRNIAFKYNASSDLQNARTRVDINREDGTIQYQVLIPPKSFITRPETGSGSYQYYIAGDKDFYSGDLLSRPAPGTQIENRWDPNSGTDATWVKKWEVFNVGSKITINDTNSDYIKRVSLLSKATVTLGLPGDTTFTYFGAADQVGPILLKVQVDKDENKTILTFSEPLDKSLSSLDKNDFTVNGESYKTAYSSGTISYDSTADNKIILGVALEKDYIIGVIKNNHLKDKKGNKAEEFSDVPVRIGRKVSSVEVKDVGNDTTKIKVTFNAKMLVLGDVSDYRVTVVPGLEDAANKKTNLIKPDSVVSDASGEYVTLTVTGMIKDTSVNGLPKVIITDDGMEDIKGTNNETLISNNNGVASKDGVGPYIVSATYNHHATDKQPAPDKTTYHVLTLTFSEPVNCQYLVSPRYFFAITGDAITQLGRDATFVQQSGFASKIDIQMGQDKELDAYGPDLVGLGDGAQIQLTQSYVTMVRDAGGNLGCMYYEPGESTDDFVWISVKSITPPWITKVTTKDMYVPDKTDGVLNGNMTEGYDGIIDTLELTWNESVFKYFSDKNLVTSKTTVKDGYYLNPNMPSWDDRDPIYSSGTVVRIPVKQKKQGYDTAVTPGFSLYLDAANYFFGSTVGPDYTNYKIDKTIEVASSNVVDGIPPYPVKVLWHEESTNNYTVKVTYSEVIDPNVYQSYGDSYHHAYNDLVAYYINNDKKIDNATPVSMNTTDNVFVQVKDYVTSSCSKETIAFTVRTSAGFDLNTVTFAPKTYTGEGTNGKIGTIKDNGVFDMAGNLAKSGPTLCEDEFPVYGAVESLPASATDTVANHAPKRSAYYMMLYGTVNDSNGDPVAQGDMYTGSESNKWSIYAYSLDNLYRFKHLSKYPSGGTEADRTTYLSKAEHDPNCVKTCEIEALLAPNTVSQNGVCYGSANIQADGRYTMYVYNEFFETPGFKEGDPIFLVIQAPNIVKNGSYAAEGKKYLVTNNCKADKFYLTFTLQVNQGIKQYDINLGNYESKKVSNGWNFVSFSTLKRYVMNGASSSGSALRDEMNNPVSETICPVVPVVNLGNVLTSLNGQWSKIYFVDGAKDAGSAIRLTSRDPKTGVESGSDKVEFFSTGYGYWIYVPTVMKGAELVVLGNRVVDNDPLYHLTLKMNSALNGVNMVGYWSDRVYAIVEPGANVKFSSFMWKDQRDFAYSYLDGTDVKSVLPELLGSPQKQIVDSIDDVFTAFTSGVSLVRCSYETGPQSWYSPIVYGSVSELSDISYVGPGFGYYVVINKDCDVQWPLILK